MASQHLVRRISDVGIGDRPAVGGKGASLGELSRAGLRVPAGYVVTALAFERALRIAEAQVERLEREIDAMNEKLSPLNSFVLPGGTALASHLHMARAIARRAESLIAELASTEKVNPAARRYANRLSDHLFVMARTANDGGMGDVLWVPGGNR